MNYKKSTLIISILILIILVSSLSLYTSINSPNKKLELTNNKLKISNEDSWLKFNQTSGLIDLNRPDQDFNIISIGNVSSDWVDQNPSDNNDFINQNSVFSTWTTKNPDTEILVVSNLYTNFTQEITINSQKYNIFSVNSSLLAPTLLINLNINESLQTSFSFQHYGFRLFYEKDNLVYNGITIIPDLIKEKIKADLIPGLKNPEVVYTVSDDRLRITYKNLLMFWQSIPQELNVELIIDAAPSILPFSYGLSTNFITVFDSITYNYVLLNNKGGTTDISNKVQLGTLSRLIINETLPDSEDWENSNQISPSPINLNLHPLLPDNIEIDFPSLSIYNGTDIAKRIQLEGKKLELQVLDNMAGFINDTNQEFVLNRYKDDNIYNAGELQQSIIKEISYRVEEDTTNDPTAIDVLTYDKKSYELGVQNGQIFKSDSSSLSPTLLNNNYRTVHSKFLETYKNFLLNYSLSKNVHIANKLFDPIQDTYLIQTNLNIWDGSPIEYYHGFRVSDKRIQHETTSRIETASFYLLDFPFLFLTLVFTIKKTRNRKNH
ncbi:MAG: hypothetical protein ACW967_06555 [Candidatus Hodarchaeales archaeon]|jgi:hypothetical protein